MAGVVETAARAILGRLELLAARNPRLLVDEHCAFCGLRLRMENYALCQPCEIRRVALGSRYPRHVTATTPAPRVDRSSDAFSAFSTPEWLPHPDD